MIAVTLPPIGTVAAFREKARTLAAAGVAPGGVLWRMEDGSADLFADLPAQRQDGIALRLPAVALPVVESALCHRDDGRFALVYSLLLRLSSGAVRWGDRTDAEMRRVLAMAKTVGRDIHKMHAFVRFRELPGEGRRRFAAWYEPSHHVVEAATPFFARRFGDMDWVIATPSLTATFADGTLEFQVTGSPPPPESDKTEALWQVYYANIFNPARLNPRMMQSEMPRKFWKNLPEAALIPELIRTAPARVQAMRAAEIDAARPPGPLPRVAAIARTRAAPEDGPVSPHDCRRCPLHGPATQAVLGEGPWDARLMIVGEQPGDQEDLQGRPFVGPAGQVLDRALQHVGLNRAELYLTNAVKHFKFRPRGKLRLHQRPDAGEIRACKWWLDEERARLKPRLIVAMGATAAEALTGTGRNILRRRGTWEEVEGQEILITLHPSYILRVPDTEARAQAEAHLRADLTLARDRIAA